MLRRIPGLFRRPSSECDLDAAPLDSLSNGYRLKPSRILPRSLITLDGPLLGLGAFGKVQVCRVGGGAESNGTGNIGRVAAAKRIRLSKLSAADVPLVETELELWAMTDHPHVVKLIGACLQPSEYIFVAELMEQGSLAKLNEHALWAQLPAIEPRLLASRLRQVASAVAHLHSLQIIHRDIKADNVLVDASGRLALGDLGLARRCARPALMTAETGSYRWMAPEVVKHEEYGLKADVYSFAIFGWEVATYCVPYEDFEAVKAALKSATRGLRPALPAHVPPTIAAILRDCWESSADARPHADELVQRLGAFLASLDPVGQKGRMDPVDKTFLKEVQRERVWYNESPSSVVDELPLSGLRTGPASGFMSRSVC